jgi:hypothetical protein
MIDLKHRVSAATNILECAREALNANPGNVTLALSLQKAKIDRDAAIAAVRASFHIAWVKPINDQT